MTGSTKPSPASAGPTGRERAIGSTASLWGIPRTVEPTHRRMLEALGRRRVPQDRVTTLDVLEILAHLAQALRREVGVLVDRHGVVSHVVLSRRWQALVEELQPPVRQPGQRAQVSRSPSAGRRSTRRWGYARAAGSRPRPRPDNRDASAVVRQKGGCSPRSLARNGVGEGPPLTEGPYPFDALGASGTREPRSATRMRPVVAAGCLRSARPNAPCWSSSPTPPTRRRPWKRCRAWLRRPAPSRL